MIKTLLLVLSVSIFTYSATWAEEAAPDSSSPGNEKVSALYAHSYFSTILKGMVLKREIVVEMFENMVPRLGTRIKPSNAMVRGADINYIPYSIITENFQDYITANKIYIQALERINTSVLDSSEQLAFWLNLRNALVLDLIFENYPIKPKEMEALVKTEGWQSPRTTINGTVMSLSDIEKLVIETWPNPLVLYGFFDGTKNSPFIMTEAFTGENVITLLEANARAYLNASGTLKISRRSITLHRVFDLHQDVYNGDTQILFDHFESFLEGSQQKALLKYSPQTYAVKTNWTINDIPKNLVRFSNDSFFALGGPGGCLMGQQSGEGCTVGTVIENNPFALRFSDIRK